MMTRTEIYKSFEKVFRTPVAQRMPHVMRILEKYGQNSGCLGWNYDVYSLKYKTGYSIAICEGYRSEAGRTIPVAIAKKYEDKARELAKMNDPSYYDKLHGEQEIAFGLARELDNL